jgi:hypothetical protein
MDLLDEFSDASVHRSLSELSPVFDDQRHRHRFLLGRDLNTWTGWRGKDPFLARDLNLVQRLEALGLVDCLALLRTKGRLEGCPCTLGGACTHTRTRRDPRRPDIPYPERLSVGIPALANRLRSCQALASDEWFSISDHAPIVAEFDLS